ncbi:MAG TPA: 4Fe-4S binding protein [Synergistales bacterium]|nr:4Fe-4S binding protein [Synergistales bacterium]
MDRKRAGAAGKLRSLFALAVLLLMTMFFLFFAGVREGGLPWLQAVPSVLRLWTGALILAASAALAGRVYCSVLCPLGTLQELIWRAGKRSASYRKPSQLSYWVLGGVVVAAAAGYMFPAAFLDPYAAFGRGVM